MFPILLVSDLVDLSTSKDYNKVLEKPKAIWIGKISYYWYLAYKFSFSF